MNLLEELHKKIEENDWDARQIDLINTEFQIINDKLNIKGSEDLLSIVYKGLQKKAYLHKPNY